MIVSIRKPSRTPAYVFIGLSSEEYLALYGTPFPKGAYIKRKITVEGDVQKGLVIKANDEGRRSFRKLTARGGDTVVETSIKAEDLLARDSSVRSVRVKPLITPRRIVVEPLPPQFYKTSDFRLSVESAPKVEIPKAANGSADVQRGKLPTIDVSPKSLKQVFARFNFALYQAKIHYGDRFKVEIDEETGFAVFTIRYTTVFKVGKPGEELKVLRSLKDVHHRSSDEVVDLLSGGE